MRCGVVHCGAIWCHQLSCGLSKYVNVCGVTCYSVAFCGKVCLALRGTAWHCDAP